MLLLRASEPHEPQAWRLCHSQVHLVLHTLRVVAGIDKTCLQTGWRGKRRGGHAFSPPQTVGASTAGRGRPNHAQACPSALSEKQDGPNTQAHTNVCFSLSLSLCKSRRTWHAGHAAASES